MVSTSLKIWKSIGMMNFPRYGKIKLCSSHHQPAIDWVDNPQLIINQQGCLSQPLLTWPWQWHHCSRIDHMISKWVMPLRINWITYRELAFDEHHGSGGLFLCGTWVGWVDHRFFPTGKSLGGNRFDRWNRPISVQNSCRSEGLLNFAQAPPSHGSGSLCPWRGDFSAAVAQNCLSVWRKRWRCPKGGKKT